VLRYVVFVSVFVFVTLMGIAMALYPGGNAWDPAFEGHHFWRNFWCDLLHHQAYNGRPNPLSSKLAWGAMCVLALGIAAHFLAAPRLFGSTGRVPTTINLLGAFAAAGLVVVSSSSSDQTPTLHGVAVLIAGPAGLTAAALTLVGLARSRRRGRASFWAGVFMVVAGLAALVQYARQFALDAPDSVWLPVSQKLATALALVWMCVVAVESRTVGD
jgi:hypothetical protein